MVLGTASTAKAIINGIVSAVAPSSKNASGVSGEVRVATSGSKRYLYICYAINNWGRIELDTTF